MPSLSNMPSFSAQGKFYLLNPLNAELNPICYLLALLAHHFLHVSRIKVKSLKDFNP
jgi:phosphatidylserine synthase